LRTPTPFLDWLQVASDCKSLRFGPLLAISGLFAALGFWFGPLRWALDATAHEPNLGTVTACIWLAWFWTGAVACAFVLHGRRGLWLLAGAPFVLAWPAVWITHAPQCSLTGCLWW
jgi:hypothetical protein